MQKSYSFTLLFLMALGGVSACKAGTQVQGDLRQEEKFMNTAKDALKAHLFSFPKSKLVLVGKAGLGVAAAWATLVCGIDMGIFDDDWSYVLTPSVAAFLAGGPAGLSAFMGALGCFVTFMR